MIDLDAYCRRIGYAGELTPTLDTLRTIHELHPRAIAFENLDPLLKRPVLLDAASLQDKMLHGGRGGYCYEHNVLFGEALRVIGFKFKALAARVMWNRPDGIVAPRGHMLLLVDVGGQSYIADVGFGGNTLTAPLALLPDVEQPTPHESFRLIEAGGEYVVQIKVRGLWANVYRFDLVEQLLPDLDQGNWYMSTHPDSPFVTELSVARVETGRRFGLRNNELAVHRLNGETERRLARSATELREVLSDLFRLKLPDGAEIDALLARFAAAPQRTAE
jgi:N-hydroxyarylamine O-acetyltransferase